MKPAFKPFFELCWIMIPISIRTFNCFSHCQSDFGIPLALFIFQDWWGDADTLWFSAIIGLKMGGERIAINDSISSVEIRGLLGVMPPKVRSKNIPLMWLYSNIDKCETIAIGTHMFMFLFIGSFLCPDLGSTVSLRYLWSLRDISQIKNYDRGGMAYATLLHFMT